jgi:hypothetical protein
MRLRRLTHDKGAEYRLFDRINQIIRQLLAELEVLGCKIQGICGSAQFHQGDEGVQPVGMFVGLGAESRRESPHGFQFRAEGLDFGAVTERGHGTEDGLPLAPLGGRSDGRTLVDHEDPGSCQVDFVMSGPAGLK